MDHKCAAPMSDLRLLSSVVFCRQFGTYPTDNWWFYIYKWSRDPVLQHELLGYIVNQQEIWESLLIRTVSQNFSGTTVLRPRYTSYISKRQIAIWQA